MKRHPQSLDNSVIQPLGGVASPFSIETLLTSSLRRRLSLPSAGQRSATGGQHEPEKVPKTHELLCKQIEVRYVWIDGGSVLEL